MENYYIPEVLIVDKSTTSRISLEYILQDQNVKSQSVSSGLVALDIISKQPPDIIIIDLLIKDMNGFWFIEQIKKNEKWKNISIFVVSKLDAPEYIDEVLNLGVAHYINKPYHFSELLAKLHSELYKKYLTFYLKAVDEKQKNTIN